MIWLYEMLAFALLGGVIWVLFRAAAERPDQPGLRQAAWLGLAVWSAFVLWSLMRSGLFEDPVALARNFAILAILAAIVLFYRRILAALRARHGER